jgi:hypothetical protein
MWDDVLGLFQFVWHVHHVEYSPKFKVVDDDNLYGDNITFLTTCDYDILYLLFLCSVCE